MNTRLARMTLATALLMIVVVNPIPRSLAGEKLEVGVTPSTAADEQPPADPPGSRVANGDCGFVDDSRPGRRKVGPVARLKSLESILQSGQWNDATRLRYTTEFAELARLVSPQYGSGSLVINEGLWISLLERGRMLPGGTLNRPIVRALTQIYINRHEYAKALRTVEPFYRTNPNDHRAAAWYEWSKRMLMAASSLRPENERDSNEYVNLPPGFQPIRIDVYFCVITDNKKAHQRATLNQLKDEVTILNRQAQTVNGKKVIGFRTIDNKQVVHFRFKSASFYKDVQSLRSSCGVVKRGDSNPKDSGIFAQYDKCAHPEVRSRRGMNFYVFDNDVDGESWGDERPPQIWPLVLIDYARLNNQGGNAEPHESGHAFGLQHVAVADSKRGTETNIMTSGGKLGFGEHQGTRTRGLTEAQTAIVVYHAEKLAQHEQIDVSGRVTSRTGLRAALKNCLVKLTASDGSERSTTTDARGAYQFLNVPPGKCRIEAGIGLEKYVSEIKTAELKKWTSPIISFRLEGADGKIKKLK